MRPMGSTSCGFCLPATFRAQGLVTLSTVYSPAGLAGSISHQQRSWDFPFGAFSSSKVSESFPLGSAHLPFHPTLFPSAEAEGRPVEPRFLGFSPLLESSNESRGLKAPFVGCSLGFFPPEVQGRKPWRRFRPTSSHVLSTKWALQPAVRCTSESRSVPAARRSSSQGKRAGATSSGFLGLHVHRHSGCPFFGLLLHLMPELASRRARGNL